MSEEITAQEYEKIASDNKGLYYSQYQEWIEHQPGSGGWIDISATKARLTNSATRKVYRLILQRK